MSLTILPVDVGSNGEIRTQIERGFADRLRKRVIERKYGIGGWR